MKQPRNKPTQAGVVLIMVLAVLTLLAIMGWAFIKTARIERSVSHSYADSVRARLVAQSGIERAVAELRKWASTKAYSPANEAWAYTGEDINKNGILDLGEDLNGNGVLDRVTLPLDEARKPENKDKIGFSLLATSGNYSGVLLSTYGAKGDYYQLKIIDSQSMININTEYVNTDVLERILTNLGKAIDPITPPIDATDAINITALRALKGRINHKEELKTLLTEDDYDRVKHYLTTDSWEDPATICLDSGVIRPQAGTACHTRYNYGAGYAAIRGEVGGYIHKEPRAPININLAEKPVLVAVLAGLKGIYLKPEDGQGLGLWHTSEITFATAQLIAQAIIERRSDPVLGAFKTWNTFNNFCDGTHPPDDPLDPPLPNSLEAKGIVDHYQAALLKANFNPNTDLNKFNPNESFFRGTDKFDVEQYSTEFCFSPAGHFEISSVGNVTKDGEIFASAQIDCVVKIWDILRHSTQSDFFRGTTMAEAPAGYPTTMADPTKVPPFYGYTFQTYPEPDITDPSGSGESLPAMCFFDGQVLLAALNTPALGYLFRAGYKENYDADNFAGDPFMTPDIKGPNLTSVANPILMGDLFPDGAYVEEDEVMGYYSPGNVAPTQGTITFWLKPNWERPIVHHHFVSLALPPPGFRAGFSQTMLFHFLYAHGDGALIMPYGDGNFQSALSFHFEGNPGDTNQRIVGQNYFENKFGSHKWIHLGISWDFTKNAPTDNESAAGRMYYNGALIYPVISRYPIGQSGPANDINYWTVTADTTAVITHTEAAYVDVTLDDGTTTTVLTTTVITSTQFVAAGTGVKNILRLGERQNVQAYGGTPGGTPDGTIDEFTVYPTMDTTNALPYSIYSAGRYYAQGNGWFLSKPLALLSPYDNNIKIGTVSWTEYNPFGAGSNFKFQIIKSTGELSAEFTDPGGANPVNLVLNPGEYIQYKFWCPITRKPLLDSPVLDDVTITLIKKPVYLDWRMH